MWRGTANAESHGCDANVTVKLCSLHLTGPINPSIASLSPSPPPTLSQFWFNCRPPLLSFIICVFIVWISRSIHPFIHSLHSCGPCVLFLFPPQRFIHPSEHPVLSIPFVGMIVIVAVVWCWLSELASQRARYGWSFSLWSLLVSQLTQTAEKHQADGCIIWKMNLPSIT